MNKGKKPYTRTQFMSINFLLLTNQTLLYDIFTDTHINCDL